MNKPLDFGMLNTQTDPRFGERPYGKFGTIAKNGCGMIALYNVQRAADGKTQFDPFYDARKPIKTNLFGLLGTRPSAVTKTLRKRGFTVKMIRPRKAAKAEQQDAVIVLYWRFWGAHYVAGIGDGNGYPRRRPVAGDDGERRSVVGVIDDQPLFIVGEQFCLGGLVFFEGGVLNGTYVVAEQVGEHGDVKVYPVNAIVVESLGGDLQRHVSHAG